MSSVFMHAAVAAAPFKRWFWVWLLVAIQAALPDLIGIWGGSWRGDWTLYLWAHQSYWWLYPFGVVYHVWPDRYMHDPAGGWYWWVYVLEACFWIVFFKFRLYPQHGAAGTR